MKICRGTDVSGSNAGSKTSASAADAAAAAAAIVQAAISAVAADAASIVADAIAANAEAIAAAAIVKAATADVSARPPPRRNSWLPSFFHQPFNKEATVAFLLQAADTAVMGLVTLIGLCMTYLFSWGQAGTTCIPAKAKDSDKPVQLSWVQVLLASLPFLVFPLALFVSGLIRAVEKEEKDVSAIGLVSALCLVEFIVAILLGGLMMVCLSGSTWTLLVSGLTIVVMVLTWGLIFKYPERLRRVVWLKIFRQEEAIAMDAVCVE